MMVNPWLGLGGVLAVFVALMAGLRAYQRSRPADPELPRKLLHLGMGLVALAFPWVFATAWPVLLLATVFVLGLAALRACPSLHGPFGGVIHGVDRESAGELYFAAAVGLLFVLSAGDPLRFGIPALVLTVADPAAALIGRHGVLRYAVAGGEKSVEGSAAFLTAALLSAQLPLLLFTDTGRTEALLIATTLGLQLTLLEAVAGRGLDNLLIPLGGFVLLTSLLEMDAPALAAQLGAAILQVVLVALLFQRRSTHDPRTLAAADRVVQVEEQPCRA